MSKMLRINETIAKALDVLKKTTGFSRQRIVEQALERYAREQFLKKTNQEFGDLKKNSKDIQDYRTEISEWDTLLVDGLD